MARALTDGCGMACQSSVRWCGRADRRGRRQTGMGIQAGLGARACPTRACRRRQTASARASLPLSAAPDAWRSVPLRGKDQSKETAAMDAHTILENVREVSACFATERRARQQRRALVAADFAQRREAGFLLTGVPVDQGGGPAQCTDTSITVTNGRRCAIPVRPARRVRATTTYCSEPLAPNARASAAARGGSDGGADASGSRLQALVRRWTGT